MIRVLVLITLCLAPSTLANLATCTSDNVEAPGWRRPAAPVCAMTVCCSCCTPSMDSVFVYKCTCAAGYYRTTWSTTSGGWLHTRRDDFILMAVRAAVTTDVADCVKCAAGTTQGFDSRQLGECLPCSTGEYATGAYDPQ